MASLAPLYGCSFDKWIVRGLVVHVYRYKPNCELSLVRTLMVSACVDRIPHICLLVALFNVGV